ncbi:MAG: type II toxin-antitoxin system RelB/DinJ family antitoxin [Caldilineae bacterium]|nr:MAG: type II toxin-antitoxin system RelB/DinJ family antitoxin [Caldilineae bacterium]
MKKVTIQTRVTPELKEEAEKVLDAMGMSTAEAIRIFLQQVVNSGSFPFQPTPKRPNPETLQAMLELENGGGEVFETPDDLFADWQT